MIHSIDAELPCEEDEEEFLTDLCACYMGFGVFLANTRFGFSQFRDDSEGSQGWQSQRSGYLPEDDLIFDTAVFIALKALTTEDALPYLKPHLGDKLKRAMPFALKVVAEIGSISA